MTLPQGNKSQVSLVEHRGIRCVRKSYNDKGDRLQKATREIAFYTYFGGCDLIPLLLDVDIPDHIYVSYVDGELSGNWLKRADALMIAAGSHDYGLKISELLRFSPAPSVVLEAIDLLTKSNVGDWPSFADEVLCTVDQHFSQNVGFDIPAIRSVIDEASEIIHLSGYWGQQLVCKLDWNAGNTFMNSTTVQAFIDFEQSFMGNKLAFVGTIIDHIHAFDWSSVRRALHAEFPDFPNAKQLRQAASFSVIYKVYGCCHEGRIEFFTPNRLSKKLSDMHELIEAAEQDAQPDAIGAG